MTLTQFSIFVDLMANVGKAQHKGTGHRNCVLGEDPADRFFGVSSKVAKPPLGPFLRVQQSVGELSSRNVVVSLSFHTKPPVTCQNDRKPQTAPALAATNCQISNNVPLLCMLCSVYRCPAVPVTPACACHFQEPTALPT